MSTDFTATLCAPDRSLADLVIAIEAALILRGGFRHDGTLFRCSIQAATGTYDEVSPEETAGPATHLAELADAVAAWDGFSAELWNDGVQLYLLGGKVRRPEGDYLNAWITISTRGLQRLAAENTLQVYYAALGGLAEAMGASAGYGHFEVAYEPLAPERAERAITDLPDYPGENATVGVLPMSHWSHVELHRAHGRSFDSIGTPAGYWILVNKQLAVWLGTA